MIRVAFKGNSIATRTGINGVEEIIIQTKAIGNVQFQQMRMGGKDILWQPDSRK